MAGGICLLSLVALRSQPGERAEMVNQLLFGELFELLDQEGNWLHVRTLHDHYTGWCHQKQLLLLSDETIGVLLESSYHYVFSPVARIASAGNPPIMITAGSKLYLLPSGGYAGPEGSEFFLLDGVAGFPKSFNNAEMNELAIDWLKAPYLWGGRSPFGVDCSGFMQVLFRLFGISLKRDARDQALQGQLVSLIAEARAGDVAFFDNEEGNIIHTGLITGSGSIVHASGEVRMDPLDHYGIYDRAAGKYSHKLRLIRRYSS